VPAASRPRAAAWGFIAALIVSVPLVGAPAELPGVLVSRQLAEARHLAVGDQIRLADDPSGAAARPFRVAGIYEPTPDPLRFAQPQLEVRLHLPDLVALGAGDGPGRPDDAVTAINVALVDPADADAFARDVAARLPGITARATSAPDARTNTFVVIERFHTAIAFVTVLGSAVFLLALMVMLVDERRSTVGILRLIGFTRGRILLQVCAEGALIALVGAAGGVLFAIAVQGLFNRFFQWRYDTALVFLRVTPAVVWQSLVIAVPLGIGASLAASWSLVRRPGAGPR
jgi:ABC-type lipoprotein release transport system permease subunit